MSEIEIEMPTEHQYYRYPGQTNPQDVFLNIDTEKNKIWIAFNSEIGNAIPITVWNGQIRRYQISAYHSVFGLTKMLEDPKIIELAERIVAGSEERDEKYHLDEDALEAHDALGDYLESSYSPEAYPLFIIDEDYRRQEMLGTITAATTDEEIDKLVGQYEDEDLNDHEDFAYEVNYRIQASDIREAARDKVQEL
jgi:hypothetical protein